MITDLNLYTVYLRVVAWNAARYEREYDHDLSVSLIQEELCEFFDAQTLVDSVDALCDTIYVALGILWKLNLPSEVVTDSANVASEQVTKMLNTDTLAPAMFAYGALLQYRYDSEYPVAIAANTIICLCVNQLRMMGLSMADVETALLIVCDSNDSKSVKKTASNVKANDGDKGTGFVPPEPRLQALLSNLED